MEAEPLTLTIEEGADYMLYCMNCSLVKAGTVAHTVCRPAAMIDHLLAHAMATPGGALPLVRSEAYGGFAGPGVLFSEQLVWRDAIRSVKLERDQARRLAYWLAKALRDGPTKATSQWIAAALKWEKLHE